MDREAFVEAEFSDIKHYGISWREIRQSGFEGIDEYPGRGSTEIQCLEIWQIKKQFLKDGFIHIFVKFFLEQNLLNIGGKLEALEQSFGRQVLYGLYHLPSPSHPDRCEMRQIEPSDQDA